VRVLRSGILASAAVHILALAIIVIFAEVYPFGSTTEAVNVDLISPEELAKLELKPPEQPAEQPAAKPPQATAPQPPADSKPATASPPSHASQTASAQPPPAMPSAPPTPPVAAIPAPEPDIAVKYRTMLGLPQDRLGENFDTLAIQSARLTSDVVMAFRRHVRSCAKLPAELSPTDNVRVVLRVAMRSDGRLATDPELVSASASSKGPALMQATISALQACQPYAMLPVDRYNEWKLLDLSFTPADLAGG
jgi:outer membrane biosynthesis protein TonB